MEISFTNDTSFNQEFNFLSSILVNGDEYRMLVFALDTAFGSWAYQANRSVDNVIEEVHKTYDAFKKQGKLLEFSNYMRSIGLPPAIGAITPDVVAAWINNYKVKAQNAQILLNALNKPAIELDAISQETDVFQINFNDEEQPTSDS